MESMYLKYDEVCLAGYYCVADHSAKSNRVVLTNFDYKNEEHWFVLYMALNVCAVTGKDFAIDAGFITRMKVGARLGGSIKVLEKKKEDTICVDVPEILEILRPGCIEVCGEDFSFIQIYQEYFKKKVK